MVGGGGLVCVLGSQMAEYPGSGPLATIVLSFLASLCWKWQGWSSTYVSLMMEPLMCNETKNLLLESGLNSF